MNESGCPRCGRSPGGTAAPLEAVIFDWFDTIAKLPTSYRSGFFDRFAETIGLALPPGALWDAWIVQPGTPRVLQDQLCGAPSFETFETRWIRGGRKLLDAYDSGDHGPAFAAMEAELHRSAPIWEDAAPTLADLTGYATAVLSDADDGFLLPNVAASGLAFEVVLSSEGLRNYKPHAEMFEEACRQLGTTPDRAVYIGDSPRADIAGALHAGLRAVWLNRTEHQWPIELPSPTAIITSLAELSDLLAAWR